jgi:hypothetical protein
MRTPGRAMPDFGPNIPLGGALERGERRRLEYLNAWPPIEARVGMTA